EGCNEYLVISKPEAVAKVHRDFLSAGADVIETNTFGANRVVLSEYDLAERTYEINLKAAQLAKQLAQEFSTPEKPRFVAGSIGPGTKLPTLGHIDFDTLVASYQEQVRGLVDGGVDVLLLETCQDVLQIKAGLQAIEKVCQARGERVPLMVSVTMEQQGTMLVGSDISAVVAILAPYPIDILGLNCATGPDLMESHIRYLSEHSPFVISCIPNAGLPENVNGKAVYRLEPPDFAAALRHFVEDLGVQIIGGCCGTRPAHIRRLVELSQHLTPKPRQVHYMPAAASIYSAQPYTQDNSFLIVGERLNASGSKKCRELLLAEDWDGLV
ncbi:MAG: homocysteine S-methyltransferase family protein, partial [Cyanobacteriota bacterium SKYGB_h_bin112]|nr:homocysteine S-methyltransferase family protein [Cyanobacteriota bacterium SKYGB_h_bin112]